MSLLRRRAMMKMSEVEVEEMTGWKKLFDETMEEDTCTKEVETDVNGNPFEVTELMVLVWQKAFTATTKYLKFSFNDKSGGISYYSIITTSDRVAKLHLEVFDGMVMDIGSFAGNNKYTLSGFSSYGGFEGVDIGAQSINKIRIASNITSEAVLTAGSRYVIYGR